MFEELFFLLQTILSLPNKLKYLCVFITHEKLYMDGFPIWKYFNICFQAFLRHI